VKVGVRAAPPRFTIMCLFWLGGPRFQRKGGAKGLEKVGGAHRNQFRAPFDGSAPDVQVQNCWAPASRGPAPREGGHYEK